MQKDCIERVVERFDAHDTKLVIILGHIHPEAENTFSSERKMLVEHVRSVAIDKSNVIVVDDGLPAGTAAEYFDLTHLAEPHRNAYTGRVLDLLRARGVL